MASLIITGGKPLRGTVNPVANKNAILKMIPAALLTNEDVIIHNVPTTTDVRAMLNLLKQLGASIDFTNEGSTIKINCSTVDSWKLDYEGTKGLKASVMFIGPLLGRFGKAYMPDPEGCKLGTRPLDSFFDVMLELGAKYSIEDGYYVEAENLKGKEIWSWFPSVTGTENLILLAAKTSGKTVIYNAACEPHTQDLCHMLVQMGAKIQGIGTNRVEIEGVTELHGAEVTVNSDHLDVGGYIAAAAMTGGELTITNAVPEHMGMTLQVFEKFGVKVDVNWDAKEIFVGAEQELEIQRTVKGDIRDVKSGPWPQYPPDLIHVATVLALKAKGNSIMHNLMYEYGFFFVEELMKMKATTVLADPNKVITFGPTEFKATTLNSPNIIQAAYALLLCCLSADGKSVLKNADPLFRRYDDVIEQFNKVGADIKLEE